MTQPDPPPQEPDGIPEEDEAYDPDEHPHPLRAKDVAALLPKEID